MQKVYYLAEFDDEKYYYDIAKQKYFTLNKNIDIPFLKKDKWIKIIFALGVFIGRKIVIPSTWLCMMITGILLTLCYIFLLPICIKTDICK